MCTFVCCCGLATAAEHHEPYHLTSPAAMCACGTQQVGWRSVRVRQKRHLPKRSCERSEWSRSVITDNGWVVPASCERYTSRLTCLLEFATVEPAQHKLRTDRSSGIRAFVRESSLATGTGARGAAKRPGGLAVEAVWLWPAAQQHADRAELATGATPGPSNPGACPG